MFSLVALLFSECPKTPAAFFRHRNLDFPMVSVKIPLVVRSKWFARIHDRLDQNPSLDNDGLAVDYGKGKVVSH